MITKSKRINVVSAFTLIELLVTIMIIGILVTLVTFGVRQAQESARDGRRRADLENIAAVLELYRAECNRYPGSLTYGGALTGDNFIPTCSSSNVYVSAVPADPQTSSRTYSYVPNGTRSSYVLCASLEQGTGTVSGCGACAVGGSGVQCNYRITRP